MKSTTIFWCATALAACANVSTPSQTESSRLSEARRLIAEDPDGALRITDALLASNPDLAEARVLAAQGSRMLALQPGRGRADLFLRDAVTQLERVVRAEEPAPETWLLLAECRFDLGDFEPALDAALAAAEGFAEVGKSAEANVKEAIRLAADADLRTFVVARQAEIDNGTPNDRNQVETSRPIGSQAMRIIQRYAQVRDQYPAESVTQTAIVFRYLQDNTGAIQELERGIANFPEQNAIHDAYINLLTQLGQREALAGSYRRFVGSKPEAVILNWHHGRALFLRADDQRQQGNYQGAINTYGKCKAAFGEYGAMVPDHAGSSQQWIALADLSTARCAVELGDLGGAEERLFAAADGSQQVYAYDDLGMPVLRDSFGGHYQGTIGAISAAHAESGEGALAATLAFNEAVLQRHPDQWGFVYNNAALAARDLGVQVENAGDSARAKELWQRSYDYYEKAVTLWPEDARTINDCGLMLVYHLGRDFERARECFDKAIELGEAQLADMDENTDPNTRQNLEEAVGDAWQNIAVMLARHQGKPFADYRHFLERAVEFYPYQRREAAAILRNGGIADNAAAAASSGRSVAATPQGGGEAAFKKAAPEARKKAEAGDYDGALALLDKIAKDCKDYAPYQAMRGDYNFRLAIAARDAGRSGIEFFFQDAIGALTRAIELDSDPIKPRLHLSQAQYEMSQFPAASKTASSLLLHMQSLGGGDEVDRLAAHTIRANAAARGYAAGKAAGEAGDAGELDAARKSFRLLEKSGKLDSALLDLWATTELWAKAPAAAVNVYKRALERTPDDQALLGKLVDTASSERQLPLAFEVLKRRKDATGLWYLGKARYMEAAGEREGGKTKAALTTLDKAVKAFGSSMNKNAAYRASCDRWIAMALGKKGNIAFYEKQFDDAHEWLVEAIRKAPESINDDLGLGESIKLGIARVADRFYQDGKLEKTEAIYRAAAHAANSDLFMLNNAGLFARDWGNQLERQSKMKEAVEMYEQSYKVYRRAQQLDPTNVRLRNDCALIAIYHLERDWDEMKQLLDSAIADGQATLRDDPPADRDERQNLDEAVGDCYENLALWHLKHSKDAKAAKAAAKASQNHHPGARRPGARRHLAAAERMLQDG